MVDVQAVIRAMTQSAEITTDDKDKRKKKPVITISRTIGSGGNDIAYELAKRLGLECYNKEILDSIAKQSKVNKKTMISLHERHGSSPSAWLFSVASGKNADKDDYVRFLEATIRWLYHKGGVILGRGGNLVLAGRSKVLRVRIIGSIDACARRIVSHDGSSLQEARKKVRESNQTRGEFIWNMFGRRQNDPINFDITFNTDGFDDTNRIVEIIIEALKAKGMLEEPEDDLTEKKKKKKTASASSAKNSAKSPPKNTTIKK